MGAVRADFGCELILRGDGEADHLQLLVAYPNTGAVPGHQYPHGRLLAQAARGARRR
jgi:hypothetical protein